MDGNNLAGFVPKMGQEGGNRYQNYLIQQNGGHGGPQPLDHPIFQRNMIDQNPGIQQRAPVAGNNLSLLSDTISGQRPFFLDFSFFAASFEEIRRLLGLAPFGPSTEMDLYHLYCLHVQGDPHILRVITGIAEISHDYNKILQSIQTAKKLSTESGPKSKSKFQEFCQSYSMEFVLENPFILSEITFRVNLSNIWEREGSRQATRKQMLKIYKWYCLHMKENQKFFESVFCLTAVVPHGPYQVTFLEEILIMFKSVPDTPNFTGPNATALAFFTRHSVGVDHEFFQRLPPILKFIVTNQPVTLQFPKMTRTLNLQRERTLENIQLCATSPSSSAVPDAIQLQFASELLNPNFAEVFSWIFFSTEDPGVFLIRNEQWSDYLTVDKEPFAKDRVRLVTTLNVKDARARFTLNVEGNFVRIVSVVTATHICVDCRTEAVFVPAEGTKSTDSAVFLIKPFSL